jgi:hypothetical protein
VVEEVVVGPDLEVPEEVVVSFQLFPLLSFPLQEFFGFAQFLFFLALLQSVWVTLGP